MESFCDCYLEKKLVWLVLVEGDVMVMMMLGVGY